MSEQDSAGLGGAPQQLRQVFLLALGFLLPQILPGFFGWLNSVLAIPIFYILASNDGRQGNRLIQYGLVISGVGAVLLQSAVAFLFSLTMVPLGYTLYRSKNRGDSPWQTGVKGIIVLGTSWAVFWLAYGMSQNVNPYRELNLVIEQGLTQTFELYKNQPDMSAELLLQLNTIVETLQALIPRILPAVLACTVIMTVWINFAVVCTLLHRLKPGSSPWPRYSRWQMPDQLVWLVIVGGILVFLGQGKLADVGICALMIGGLLYCLQGLAVFIFLMERWKLAPFFRMLLYLLLIIQSYGLVLLVLLGLAEIWFDFRKLTPRHTADN